MDNHDIVPCITFPGRLIFLDVEEFHLRGIGENRAVWIWLAFPWFKIGDLDEFFKRNDNVSLVSRSVIGCDRPQYLEFRTHHYHFEPVITIGVAGL